MSSIKINQITTVVPLCVEYERDGLSYSHVIYFDYKNQKVYSMKESLNEDEQKDIIQYWLTSKALPNTTAATLPNMVLSQLNNINSETQNKVQEKQNES